MFKKTTVGLVFCVSFFIGPYSALNEVALAQEASPAPANDALAIPSPQIDVNGPPTITPTTETPVPVDPETNIFQFL
jgi:hypothetical protein